MSSIFFSSFQTLPLKHMVCAAVLCVSPLLWAGDLVLVRHGNSEHNMANEYNSNPEHEHYKVSNLTALGKAQAQQSAQRLLQKGYNNHNIAAVYVSPLPRTQETAQILAEEGLFDPKKIRTEPRLIEVRAGNRESLSTELFDGDHWERHDAYTYQGETNTEVKNRVLALYDEVVQKQPEGHILFVTHGMPTYELIDELTLQRIRLQTAEAMVLPLKQRAYLQASLSP